MEVKKGVITSKERKEISLLLKENSIQLFIKEYENELIKYSYALSNLETEIKIYDNILKESEEGSPIESIKTRLKSSESAMKKMMRNNLELNMCNLRDNIQDIAGMRIICSFISDVYNIAEIIKKNKDIEVIKEKDYIKKPKASGYRSYHLIVKVPINTIDGDKEYYLVEIQIRTIGMNFWASLEHKIKYKNDGYISEDAKNKLIECADKIFISDNEMMILSNEIKNIII